MARRHVCDKVPVSAREPLLGMGTRLSTGGRSHLVLTSANRNGGNRRHEEVRAACEGMGVDGRGREVPECSAEGSPIDVDPLAFAILRRGCSTGDGNNFYGEGLTSREHHDASIQYGREACHAVMTLEGLNVVPEDLAVAALVGRTAREVIRPGDAPIGDPHDALARVVARMVSDGAEDVEAARRTLDDVMGRVRALLDAHDVAGVQRSELPSAPDA